MKHYFIYFFILFSACVPVQSNYTTPINSQIPFELTDKIYDAKIHTVQLFPDNNQVTDQLNPPVINILNNNLVLEFDELVEKATTHKAKIYNCTAGWKKSALNSIEYLYEYNEFDIFEYEYSLDTDFPYVHYRFNIPKVKIPGNYLLKVYRNGNEDDVLITKRFMVFENKIDIVVENLADFFYL